MPTPGGVVTVAVCMFCLLIDETWLYQVLICSALFQSSSAVNFGHFGIQPFFIVALFFLWSQMRKRRFWTQRFRSKRLLLFFGALGITSAFLYPVLFEGTRVYNPHLGVDSGYLNRSSLQFGLANWAQAMYLAIDVLVVVAVASLRDVDSGRRAFHKGFYILAALVIAQSFCMTFGIVFPYELLQTNPGYAMSSISSGRAMGSFTEPSIAGLAFSIYYACFYFEFVDRGGSAFKLLLCAVSIVLVRSSAALFSVLIISAMLFLRAAVADMRSRFRPSTVLRSVAVPLLAAALVATPPIRAIFQEHVLEKSDTKSFFYRKAADTAALDIAKSTYGVGVGLGSNRPSSLLCAILSNMGVAGTGLFAVFVWRIASALGSRFAWARWALIGGLIDAMLCIPDITIPMIWVVLALAAQGIVSHLEKDSDTSLLALRKTGAMA